MTLITQSTKAVAQGNGATVAWPFTFLIPAVEDLVLTLVDVASGNPTIISPVNYTVTGLGNANGGTVTYPLTGSPVPSTSYVVVERFVPDVQETDLTNQGAVYPADIEDALDYLTMITQQLQDQVDRSIVFSVADMVEVTLPPATARANLFLGFNSSGAPIAVSGLTPGTTVSAAMIPVVTAPTTAAALTALGIPGSLLDLLIPPGTIWDYAAGGTAPTGFVYPIGQACTSLYPNYRANLISAGSPFGTNGTDPLMPDLRSVVVAGKSNMGGTDNGLLTGGTVLGALLGLQSSSLAANQIPTITSVNAAQAISVVTTVNGVPSGQSLSSAASAGGSRFVADWGTSGTGELVGALTSTGSNSISVVYTNGSLQPFSRVQPTLICNKILKVS